MKNGIPEAKDADVLMNAYRKINHNGMLSEPFTTEEQVMIFCMVKYIRENFNEKAKTNRCDDLTCGYNNFFEHTCMYGDRKMECRKVSKCHM